jgi:hypothetical protein
MSRTIPTPTVAALRLAAQQIASRSCTTPAAVIAHLTAMQAQDYRGALWSIGLRIPNATSADVERAIADRQIVRTWPMRGTLHFVAADDVRWMLRLLTPRIIKGGAGRRRQIGLDDAAFAHSRKLFTKALRDGNSLTRDEMHDVLERAKISTEDQRGYHILARLSMDGLLCFAEPRGKQHTFALLDEWIPTSRILDRDESLAELASRYFRSHGPATARDFAWWSGLTLGDARAGIALAAPSLADETINGVPYIVSRASAHATDAERGIFLLPGFDELLLGYTDRTASLGPAHAQRVVPGGNGVFKPTIVSNGRVVGTWKAALAKGKVIVTPLPFAALSTKETRALHSAAARYARFILGDA